jgi:penicillin amidase
VANGINATYCTGRCLKFFGRALRMICFAGLVEEASEKAIAGLDINSESYKLTVALESINIWRRGDSIEFQLVGVRKINSL